jgi:predicted dehydrogenase
MFKVGVIGCGYWGPNLIRNFTQMSRTSVIRIADLDPVRLNHMQSLYPNLETTPDYNDIISQAFLISWAVFFALNFEIRFLRWEIAV